MRNSKNSSRGTVFYQFLFFPSSRSAVSTRWRKTPFIVACVVMGSGREKLIYVNFNEILFTRYLRARGGTALT